MLSTIIVCLTISTANTLKAPEPPAWQGDMPQAIDQGNGTFFPTPSDAEIMRRLMFLDAYPGLCQKSIDSAIELGHSEALEELDTSWQWKLSAVLGVALGGVVGYKIGGH